MADLLNIKIKGSKGIVSGRLEDAFDQAEAKHLLREAIKDIGDKIEEEIKRTVPIETGTLKAHPVERDTRFGLTTSIPGFGGTTIVRGPTGFIGALPGAPELHRPGEAVRQEVFSIPDQPRHALWVHEGTGIYGPTKKRIFAKVPGQRMKFPRWSKAIDRRPQWRLESVKGQAPQPYIRNAYLLINSTYIPARIELLRAQIIVAT